MLYFVHVVVFTTRLPGGCSRLDPYYNCNKTCNTATKWAELSPARCALVGLIVHIVLNMFIRHSGRRQIQIQIQNKKVQYH